MSTRLTVVFDDESLYRRAKVRAAEEGVAMKQLVETALAEYLRKSEPPRKLVDPLEILKWMEQAEEEDENPDGPTDLSDVKQHLYGWPPQELRRRQARQVAEERGAYDAARSWTQQ